MPKVIDLPTATSMDAGDYFVMEESTGGTKKITRNNVEKRVTTDNVVTRTSGATLSSSVIYVSGKVATISVSITTTETAAAGTNCFEGTLASGYRPPVNSFAFGYIGGALILGVIRSNGTIVFRVIGASVAANADLTVNGTYLLS